MSLAPCDLNQQRKELACHFYEAKVRKAVFDTLREFTARSGMKGKRRQIAVRFRANVLRRTGFYAFEACYRGNSACYRLGWVLSKRVKETYVRVWQALAAWETPAMSLSLERPENTLSAILNYRRTEETLSSGSHYLSESPLLRSRNSPETPLVKAKSLVFKLTRFLLTPSFSRLKNWSKGSFSEFNFPIKEDLRRTQKVKAEETKGLVDSRASEALLKSARLSQKVSSILKLIDDRRTPSDTSRSIKSRESTPKRNLNLRIPTTGSVASSPPMSPISMGDLESDTSRMRPLKQPTSSSKASPRSFNLDLSQLDKFERRIEVWKAWKDLIMQRKLYNLKKSIAQRCAKLKSLRKTWKSLVIWRGKRGEKLRKRLVAESFYKRKVKKRAFRRLTASLLLLMQNSHITRLHPTHLLLQILSNWYQITHFRAIHKQKLTLFSRYTSLKLLHRYFKLWNIVLQVRERERKQEENALFFWYSNAMPGYWRQFVRGVEAARAGKVRGMQADRNYAFKLIRKGLKGWARVCEDMQRIREAEEQAKEIITAKKTKEALVLLRNNAFRRRKVRITLAAVSKLAAAKDKSKAMTKLQMYARRSQIRSEKVSKALLLYGHTLMGKSLLEWRVAAERKRNCSEAGSIISENRYFACISSALLQWRNALAQRRNGLNRIVRKQEKTLLSFIFSHFKSACKELTARRLFEIGKIMAHQDFLTNRLFSLWKQEANRRKQHKIHNKCALSHYLRLRWKGWVKAYKQLSSLRKLSLRNTLKQNWTIWKVQNDSNRMEECSEMLAIRHYREQQLSSVFRIWHENKAVHLQILAKAMELKGKKDCERRKDVWKAWITARLLLKREQYADKLAKNAEDLRNQKIRAFIVTFMHNYARKSAILRKKSTKMRKILAFSHFERAIEASFNRNRLQKRLKRKAEAHLTQTRFSRGLQGLSRKVTHKHLLTSLCQKVLKSRILASMQRWRGYGNRYLRLLQRADMFRLKKDLIVKQKTVKWLLRCGGKSSWERRMERRLFFYWDQRVKRVFLAWKQVFTYKKELDAVVLKLQLTVLLKAYFSTLQRYSAAQRKLKAYKSAQVVRRKATQLRHSFTALQNYALTAIFLRKGHLEGLKMHANCLALWVFKGWKEYIKVKITQNFRHKRLKLEQNMRLWEARKTMQCAMSYVQPRLRKVTGMKLGALFKWKLAVSRPVPSCPTPAAHVFMKYLVPKIDQFQAITSPKEAKNSVISLIFPQWRAAVLYNRLFLDVRGAIYRRRLLGKVTLLRLRKGTLMARVRRKKTWNAVLFSRLKGKFRVFQDWRRATELAKRPKSIVRSRTPGGKTRSVVKT